MEDRKIYEDIALRTEGDIYIGVVGPVRTGKSTFIKRFMETLVIPNIENVYRRERARDELPQSGSGRTIMTAEPKFVPEEAVAVQVDGGAAFQMRMIDCVGYLVPSAVGQLEGENERMVTTPWFEHEIPMAEAAEIGTRKVISEHSTIGIVVTTDGTITDIPREDYLEAEERVISELKELGKPFVVLLNSANPGSERARAIRSDIAQRYDVTCVAANCLELDQEEINAILKSVLYEFPVKELDLFLPPWVDALPQEHPIKAALYGAIREGTAQLYRVRDVDSAVSSFRDCEVVSDARISNIDLGTGVSAACLELPRSLFYNTLSQQSGFEIGDDGDLMALLTQLAGVKKAYDKVADALRQVEETGYGIVVPPIDSLVLEEPEIMRQGGRYGVRLKASAPSIHIIWNKKKFRTAKSPEWKGPPCGVGGHDLRDQTEAILTNSTASVFWMDNWEGQKNRPSKVRISRRISSRVAGNILRLWERRFQTRQPPGQCRTWRSRPGHKPTLLRDRFPQPPQAVGSGRFEEPSVPDADYRPCH